MKPVWPKSPGEGKEVKNPRHWRCQSRRNLGGGEHVFETRKKKKPGGKNQKKNPLVAWPASRGNLLKNTEATTEGKVIKTFAACADELRELL